MNALGWTLIHSIWELSAVAALFALATLFLRKSGSNRRYLAALSALLLCAILPIGTYGWLQSRNVSTLEATPVVSATSTAPTSLKATIAAAVQEPASLQAPVPKPATPTVQERVEAVIPDLVWAWTIGLILMIVRLSAGLFAMRKTRRNSLPLNDAAWSERLKAISDRLGVRRLAEIRLSDDVDVPAVIGFLKAVVLFPTAAVSGMSAEQLELLLAHEIAHIRRHDLAVNLFQAVVESILFYHPAIWWISSIVRTEREHACDELAVMATGNRQAYATTLLAMEQLRTAPRLAMSANRGSLLARIQRLAGCGDRRLVPASGWISLLLVLVISSGLLETLQAKSKRHDHQNQHTIEGRVATLAGGPAAGADVYLQPSPPDKDQWLLHETADQSGRFQFKAALSRSYVVLATMKGVGTAYETEPKAPTNQKPVLVNLTLRPTGKIRLRILDKTGKPVSGLRIGPELFGEQRLNLLRTPPITLTPSLADSLGATTDELGRAVIDTVPVGEPYVLANRDARYAGFIARGLASQDPRQIDVRVTPACEVEGLVTADGHPVKGQLSFKFLNTGAGVHFFREDGQGHVFLSRVAQGKISMTCMGGTDVPKGYVSKEITVNADASKTAHFEIKFVPGAQLSVHVVDRNDHPAANCKVALVSATSARPTETKMVTDQNGIANATLMPDEYSVLDFRSDGRPFGARVQLKPGEHKSVTLTKPSETNMETVLADVVRPDGTPSPDTSIFYRYKGGSGQARTNESGVAEIRMTNDAAQTAIFSTQFGGNLTNTGVQAKNGRVTIRLKARKVTALVTEQASYSITGQVTVSGQPVEGAKLYAFRYVDGWHSNSFYTGKDGRFNIVMSSGGKTMVRCVPPANMSERYISRTGTVDLHADHPESLNFMLELGAKLHVVVTDDLGHPVVRHEFYIHDASKGDGDVIVARTGANGAMDLLLPSGTYSSQMYRSDGAGFAQHFTLTRGESKTLRLQVPSESDMTTIQVKVLASSGKPARYANVLYHYQAKVNSPAKRIGIAMADVFGTALIHIQKDLIKGLTVSASLPDEWSDSEVGFFGKPITIRLHKVKLAIANGFVKDSSGAPIPKASVEVSQYTIGGAGIPGRRTFTVVPTLANGMFTVFNLYPQYSFDIEVSAKGYKAAKTMSISHKPGELVKVRDIVLEPDPQG